MSDDMLQRPSTVGTASIRHQWCLPPLSSPNLESNGNYPVDDFERRVYLIAAPFILTLGLCGNFAVIAILSKQRFRPFPVTSLIKSHAIANIFCLFIGLFLGDFVRAQAQSYFGTFGCRIHVMLSYTMRYVTSWHYVVTSCFRVFMAVSPSLYVNRNTKTLVRGAIVVILILALALAFHILWSLTNDIPASLLQPQANVTATTQQPDFACSLTLADSFNVTWRLICLVAAIVIPFAIVLFNAIALPLYLYRKAVKEVKNERIGEPKSLISSNHSGISRSTGKSMLSPSDASVISSPIGSGSRAPSVSRRRRLSDNTVLATNLASILHCQDVVFLSIMLPLVVYFSLVHFPTYNAGESSCLRNFLLRIFPVSNLLLYTINVAQFPIFALGNKSTRRPSGNAQADFRAMKLKVSKRAEAAIRRAAGKLSVELESGRMHRSAGTVDNSDVNYKETSSKPNYWRKQRDGTTDDDDFRPDDIDMFVAALTGTITENEV